MDVMDRTKFSYEAGQAAKLGASLTISRTRMEER